MSSPSTKIAWGVAVLVVAGLVAIAAPAVTAVLPVGNGPVAAPDASAPSTAKPATDSPTENAAAEDTSTGGAPAGYVGIGHGTSIPAGGPGDCKASAYIWIGSDNDEPMHAEMLGADMVDMGPREFATGGVGLDDQGRPATYTVAPGDVTSVIGDRFCIYNGIALETLNMYPGGDAIQPGDVLTLNADLVTDWVSPYGG
ncbi:hypothetical protein [Microbacterium abyssi]|uniref:hypothetical protein n=1 Tax=Microbacterium abyssi TaxID=2782166 RepID=UPI001888C5D9|nr:hypothetical protein [Microbacterium sp. A18JL241]